MLYLIVPLVAGILSGYLLLRGRKHINLNKVTFGIILVLIFSLGFTIGSNNELLSSIPKVGLSALGMSVLAIAFSVLFVVLIKRRLRI
jgi:membrane associated rhomboid family serine protease